ncbi:MAG: hypothetical protein K8H90_03845, partial [Thermoanaerobaculia bacterium]|nr:hypothetical protein [Thermoanaerobaculia bacterium]
MQVHRSGSVPAAFDDFTDGFAAALESLAELTSVTWQAYDLEPDGVVERLRVAILSPATGGPAQWTDRFSVDGAAKQLRRLRRRLLSVEDPVLRAWLLDDPLDLRSALFELDRSRGPGRPIGVAPSRYFDDPGGEWRLVFVQPARPSSDAEYCLRLRRRIDELAAQVAARSGATGVSLRYGGLHGAVAESQSRLKRDMAVMTGLTFLLLTLVLSWSLRRPVYVLLALLPLAISLGLFLGVVRCLFNPLYSHNIGVGAA